MVRFLLYFKDKFWEFSNRLDVGFGIRNWVNAVRYTKIENIGNELNLCEGGKIALFWTFYI